MLTLGYSSMYYAFGKNVRVHENTQDNLLGLNSILPVGIWFNDTNHEHFAGYMRNVYSGNEALPESSGTLSGANYMHRSDTSEPQIVVPWDGLTAFGRDSSGSLFLQTDISSSFFSNSFSFFAVEPDTENIRFWNASGSNVFATGSGGTTIINIISGTLITSSVDGNRIRITYPSIRRRPRPTQLIEQTITVS